MLVVGVLLVKLFDPNRQCLGDLGLVAVAEFAADAIAGAVFVFLQKIEQLRDRLAVDFGSLDWWPALGGDAPDSAMVVVAVRVSQRKLHMPNQRVIPVDNVQRPIGP